MKKEPEIIRILKEEEKLNLLYSSNISSYKEQKIEDEYSNKEKKEINEEYSSYQTNDDINLDLKEQIKELKKVNQNLEKQLKQSKEKFDLFAEYFEILSEQTIALGKKDLFSDVSDIIFQIKPDGRITYVNSAVEDITGYSSTEIIGNEFFSLIPKNDWIKLYDEFFSKLNKKDMMKKEVVNFETYVIHKNKGHVPVEINCKLIDIAGVILGRKDQVRIQGSIRDITERKRSEEKLKTMNEELNTTNSELHRTQKELKILNEDLEKKVVERTSEIEKLLKHKDEFIDQLGHDLKSPLTPIIGLLPTISDEIDDPKIQQLLNVIDRNVNYMKDLVTKTLELERLNAPNIKPNLEEVNLFEIINKITNNKVTILNDKKIKIINKINKNYVLNADKLHMKELFDNLISNSIKFTEKNGKITFNVKKQKERIRVSIKDTGIGMIDEQLEHIFEDFYKADPSRHDLEASGLGLSICKKIVDMHKGNIWAESPGINKGSIFYVEFPLNLKDTK
jgi:PAS domain S-box-containing protein